MWCSLYNPGLIQIPVIIRSCVKEHVDLKETNLKVDVSFDCASP